MSQDDPPKTVLNNLPGCIMRIPLSLTTSLPSRPIAPSATALRKAGSTALSLATDVMAQFGSTDKLKALHKMNGYLIEQSRTSHGRTADHYSDVEAAFKHLLNAMSSKLSTEVRGQITSMLFEHAQTLDPKTRSSLEKAADEAFSAKPPAGPPVNAGKAAVLGRLPKPARVPVPYADDTGPASSAGRRPGAQPAGPQGTIGSMLPSRAGGRINPPPTSSAPPSSGISASSQGISQTSVASSAGSYARTPASSIFDGSGGAARPTSSNSAINSHMPDVAAQDRKSPTPSNPEVYDKLVKHLVVELGWQDSDLKALAACMKQCRALPDKGSIRNAAIVIRNKSNSQAHFQEIYSQIPGFMQDNLWMRRMGAAIERHQKAPPQIDTATAAPHINLLDQEDADLQRALAESRANYLDNHYANSADGVKKFRENMKNLGIDIVPNEGDRHSNCCLIVSMMQQVNGGKDFPETIPQTEVISQALATKKDMADASEGKVTVEGLVDPESTTKHMAWLRDRIARKYNVLIDPHIVQADHQGNPVFEEPREPLPGHVPVLIFNQGAHFEAMQFTASTSDFRQRHWEAFEMVKTISSSVVGG